MKKALVFVIMLICFFPLDSFGDECVAGDCVNGKGTLVFSTGHKYTGEFKDGVRHGDGVMLLPGGRKIVGVWKNNMISEGTYTKPDGTRYEGHWEFRERNGQGILTYPDGRKYTGAFQSGQRHGKGTMIYPDGRKYVGDFNFGERTGNGTMTYPDGRKYVGAFEAGEKDGQGILTYPDGRKLEGLFKSGEFVGK